TGHVPENDAVHRLGLTRRPAVVILGVGQAVVSQSHFKWQPRWNWDNGQKSLCPVASSAVISIPNVPVTNFPDGCGRPLVWIPSLCPNLPLALRLSVTSGMRRCICRTGCATTPGSSTTAL